MPTDAEILTAGGLVNVDALIEAAATVGVPLWLAAALVQQESSGRNVYGNDLGGTFATPGEPDIEVTEANFAEFLELVVNQGGRSNGVGPLQITYAGALRPDGTRDGGYFTQAAAQGLRLWVPVENLTFGLRLIASNLRGDYSPASIERAGTLYNAGNLNGGITDYGRQLAAKAASWLVALTPPPAPPESGEPMNVKDALSTLGWRVDTSARLAQAVKDFQRGWNLGTALAVDGNAGPKTVAALTLSLARKAKGLPDFSENFSAREFRCACGGADSTCRRIWVMRELVRACEKYRTLVGPLAIERGCRCPTQNRAVGGATNSQHLYGSGADVSVYRISVSKLQALGVAGGIGTYEWGGVGYPRHIDVRHVFGMTDSRNTTRSTVTSPARWSYGTAKSAPLAPNPGGTVTAPAPAPAPAPTPAPSLEVADMTADQLKALMREVLAEPATAERLARTVWTSHNIVKDATAPDPETAPRVTPSRLLEAIVTNTNPKES